MRIGMGYDVHKLVPDRKLIMGGVEIPYVKGLFILINYSNSTSFLFLLCLFSGTGKQAAAHGRQPVLRTSKGAYESEEPLRSLV